MASLSYSYCTVDLPDHISTDCLPRKLSGISAIGLALPGHTISDFSNKIEVEDNIESGKFKVIGGCDRGTRFEYPAATPVEGDPDSACQDKTVDGYDHIVNGEDFNVSSENDAFYAELHKAKGVCVVLYYCEEDEIRVIDGRITFTATNPASDFSNKIKQKYVLTATWFAKNGNIGSTLMAAPEGVFC
jgi:hypothetical protein